MESMILGISASPQKEGKVETLLQEILTASRLRWEMGHLHELTVGPCKACGGCRSNNVCQGVKSPISSYLLLDFLILSTLFLTSLFLTSAFYSGDKTFSRAIFLNQNFFAYCT